MAAQLEHANITVTDPRATAALLHQIFGWQTRWEGPAKDEGFTVHVGTKDSYLALYAPKQPLNPPKPRYVDEGSLAHIGIVVDDLAATEARVTEAGFTPHSHGDYEPGQRFYFDGPDGVEYEVISYE
jgi:catechol 2,3-dioxygenase-like lactoylglutathione lyase family enzyme